MPWLKGSDSRTETSRDFSLGKEVKKPFLDYGDKVAA
jgi:hypothetical protein